jgi:hypothetical protein
LQALREAHKKAESGKRSAEFFVIMALSYFVLSYYGTMNWNLEFVVPTGLAIPS